MSDPCPIIPDMNLDRLIEMKADTSTLGRMDYIDVLLTDAIQLCRRPGDVQRVAETIDQLVTELASHRTGTRAWTTTSTA